MMKIRQSRQAWQVTNRIKEFRLKKGYTQEDLARKMGTTRNTITAFEKGHYSPTILHALLLCKVLECTIEELFTLERIEEE